MEVAARTLTRRDLLRAGGAGAVALGAGALRLDDLERALAATAASPACGRLTDIEHVVIFIQENRSFDNYFGTYRGVRGFSDPGAKRLPDGNPVFSQPGYPAPGFGGRLLPFRLDTEHNNGECTNDITHDWGPQHRAWNGGRMDSWVTEHLASDGQANGPLTMGYYQREDLPYYHALADAFTLCDRYFCSLIGPTDPNRLYSVSGTIDPDGRNGGPQLQTLNNKRVGAFTWTTMPEQLESRGISWKVYGGPDANFGDNDLVYFRAYSTNPTLASKAFGPVFPDTFQADVAANQLPQVSWVLAPLVQTEHPPAPVAYGEYATSQVVSILMSNPDVWAKTVLFITWDENGGFFDHVPPPTPPPGTPGEYLTISSLPPEAEGIRGPIGLGFRVPMIVVSPFSRGGLASSDIFDHTSTLRFIETRFGAEAPNLSEWRRSVTGDLTAALNITPDRSIPSLPSPSLSDPRVTQSNCPTNAPASQIEEGLPIVQTYPVPPNHMPSQEPGTRGRPTGLECVIAGARPGAIHLTVTPMRPRLGRRTRFTFRATTVSAARLVPVAGARIYLAGRHTRTNSQGRAQMRLTLHRLRAYPAVARKAGLLIGRVRVRTRRRRRRASRSRAA
jgi:phospholipase C